MNEQTERRRIIIDLGDKQAPAGAVVFDMDGTLTQPYLDFKNLRERLGLPEGDILHWINSLEGEAYEQANAIIHDFEDDGVRNARLNDGALQALEAVRDLGLPAAIVTRNTRRSARAVCERLGIGVHCCITRDDAPAKPDPSCLLQIGELFGVPAAEMVMVGDYRHDTETARAAGAIAVLVTNGREPPWEVDADLVIERVGELAGYLKPVAG